MDILDKISGYGKVQDPISDIFYGLLTFATAAACAHGTNIIVNKLIDMGYGATTSIEAHGVKATVTITPPPRELQDRLTVGGVVPQYITSNWNAAVAADSTDNPTNGGV
ncbi:MAG: hypothetical protein LQ342_006000 [Letrouitia transgressa]|nr:MAG: hypothetical protein LQ342_006000 [Letrouitia transgressa]